MIPSPILLVSTFCKHSVDIVDLMKTDSKKFNDIILLKIDIDPVTKKRPQAYYDIQNIVEWSIKSVPTIVTKDAKEILSGEQVFEWVNARLEKGFAPSNALVNEIYSGVGESSCINVSGDASFCNKKDISGNYEQLIQSRQPVQPERSGPPRQLSPPIKV